MIDFGIVKIPQTRHCSVHGCRNNATHAIGNTKNYYQLKNMFLCEEHLEQLYNVLKSQYNIGPAPEEKAAEETVNIQPMLKDFISMLYNNYGVSSKAKIIEFCKEHNIELPEAELNMKGYMEILFKDLL